MSSRQFDRDAGAAEIDERDRGVGGVEAEAAVADRRIFELRPSRRPVERPRRMAARMPSLRARSVRASRREGLEAGAAGPCQPGVEVRGRERGVVEAVEQPQLRYLRTSALQLDTQSAPESPNTACTDGDPRGAGTPRRIRARRQPLRRSRAGGGRLVSHRATSAIRPRGVGDAPRSRRRGRDRGALDRLPARPRHAGLVGVELAISDAHAGLKAAIAKVLGCAWQRCTVHFLRDCLGTPARTSTACWRPARRGFRTPELRDRRPRRRRARV